MKRTPKICEYCGLSYMGAPRQRFHNSRCAARARGGREERVCKGCGRRFWPRICEPQIVFHSPDCKKAFQKPGEKSIEVGYAYILNMGFLDCSRGFRCKVFKVGHTINLRARLSCYRSTARMFSRGYPFLTWAVACPRSFTKPIEEFLCDLFRGTALPARGSETFAIYDGDLKSLTSAPWIDEIRVLNSLERSRLNEIGKQTNFLQVGGHP